MNRWLIEEDPSFCEITDRLNEEGVTTDLDRPWNSGTVRTVMTKEKYIGNNVYNRSSLKLKKLHDEKPPDTWALKEGAFEGIPLTNALDIARAKHDDENLGEMMEEAFKTWQLKGHQIMDSECLIEKGPKTDGDRPKLSSSAHSLMKTYQRDFTRDAESRSRPSAAALGGPGPETPLY